MRGGIFLLAVALALTGCANRHWTRNDTIRQFAATFLMAVDWKQTHTIATHPERFYEMNPILGEHPEPSRVNVYFPVCMIVNTVIAYAIPDEYRPYWQYGTIIGEGFMVVHNHTEGIR